MRPSLRFTSQAPATHSLPSKNGTTTEPVGWRRSGRRLGCERNRNIGMLRCGTFDRSRCLCAARGDTGEGEDRGSAMHALLKIPREMVTEFACWAYCSPAVVYPCRLSDEAPVKCQRCRTVLCTLREFRLSAEQGTA